MTQSKEGVGCFRNGLPYNRLGQGPRVAVVFQGLLFENKPPAGLWARVLVDAYRFLETDYTAYIVIRKPGLPDGYSLKDMADDYAVMIREEFGGPVDVIGVSTGGSIAQHFAADHPDLVRRLVIHSSAYTLSDVSKQAQLRIGHFARQRKWREAYAVLASFMIPKSPISGVLVWLGSLVMSLSAPKDPSDLVVTIEAEDAHDFKDRLVEITVPTLVVAGDKDPFYTDALFRTTAEGIPNARLSLYPGVGHPAAGKQFERDVLVFLNETCRQPTRWRRPRR
jgi:pimeloyl-ACP methyl ester carboxylesterase